VKAVIQFGTYDGALGEEGLEELPTWEMLVVVVPPFSEARDADEDDNFLAVDGPRFWVKLVLFGGGGPI
jgi:hypothetical protein